MTASSFPLASRLVHDQLVCTCSHVATLSALGFVYVPPRNVQGFPRTGPAALHALGFHAGTATILALYLLFWLRLNLLQTLPTLAALELATMALGASLSAEAARSKQD